MPERRRVLVLAPFPPRLDGRHGGSRAIAHLVAGLAGENRVALAYLRATDEPPLDPELAAACERVHEGPRPGVSFSSVRPWPRAFAVLPGLAAGKPLWVAARWSAPFARAVRDLAAEWRPHVVQTETTAVGQYLPAVGAGPARVVTIQEPGGPAAWERVISSGGAERVFWRTDARRWERYEREVLRRADAAVVFTGRDLREVERLGAGTRAVRVPLAVAVPGRALDPVGEEPPMLLFAGSFVHPPNLDAALHLVRDVFPRLRGRFPGLRLCLAGDGAPASLRGAAGEGVEVTGWVPELEPYLRRAAVVVAPLRRGGGMRVKVAEALAAGKAVVATPLALEGLEVEPGTHALAASGADAFAAAVAGLLDDPDRRARIGRAARAWASAHLGPSRTAESYGALYDSLLEERSAPGTLAGAAR